MTPEQGKKIKLPTVGRVVHVVDFSRDPFRPGDLKLRCLPAFVAGQRGPDKICAIVFIPDRDSLAGVASRTVTCAFDETRKVPDTWHWPTECDR